MEQIETGRAVLKERSYLTRYTCKYVDFYIYPEYEARNTECNKEQENRINALTNETKKIENEVMMGEEREKRLYILNSLLKGGFELCQ